MGYSADSFSAGEQPTTAKWNKLWSNDASFNDGTGIANLEIGSGHTSLKNDYKFSVYRNAAQSISASTTSKVAFDTKFFDTGSNFDVVTNNRFIAPVSGFYQFSGAITVATGGGETYAGEVWKNGAALYRTRSQSSGVDFVSTVLAPPPIQLTATDFIEVFFFNGSGGTKALQVGTGPAQSYFGGFLISQT